MDYDLVKCETLLFFVEYLMKKGSPRKLSDLSCRFGCRGFTNDMRVIVRSLAGESVIHSLHNLFITIELFGQLKYSIGPRGQMVLQLQTLIIMKLFAQGKPEIF